MRKTELSEHFTPGKMLLYSLPAIIKSFAITSFQMVDGYFVSTFLGVVPFVAVTMISPVFFLLYAMGFMFGEGASALISQYMGEGNRERGCAVFSMTTVVMLISSTVIGIAAALLMPFLARMVGAAEENIGYCIVYGRLMVIFLPIYMVNSMFMSLWITAGKGWLGMVASAINGLTNVVLDWLFMGPLGMGVEGAALATFLAALISAAYTLVYFWMPNGSSLRFCRFSFADFKALIQICSNGASAMVDSVTGNLTHLLMNRQLIRYVGEIGVAAMGVYDYVAEFFAAVLLGISTTTITVVGYKYGEKNRDELDGIVKTNTALTLGFGVVLCLVFIACAEPVARLYVGYDAATCALTVRAIRIMALSCTVYGFILFASAFFTGLGNGRVSAFIALCNSLIAPVLTLIAIPAVFGGEAIWFAIPVAMLFTTLVCIGLLATQYYRRENLWPCP